nr:MAG TPA: hypothetical protein [Caudoviricetes sp.]
MASAAFSLLPKQFTPTRRFRWNRAVLVALRLLLGCPDGRHRV